MKCPYYRKVSVENHPFGVKSYCEGNRLKGLRVPSTTTRLRNMV
jgi:hypothetical protein